MGSQWVGHDGMTELNWAGLSCSGSASQVLHRGTDSAGCAFCALPRPKQLRWPGAWRAHCPRWAVCLNHLTVPAAQFPRCAVRASSQVCHASPESMAGADLWLQPSWQMSTIQDPRKFWLATGNLLTVWCRMPVSGVKIAPCLLALAFACLSLFLQWWEGPVCSLLAPPLVFIQSFVLWEGQGTLGYSFLQESSLFLFFWFSLSGYPTVWVAISHYLPRIVLRALRLGPYPKHANCASLSSLRSLVAVPSVWATSPLGIVVRHVFCVLFCFVFLPVILPSEIPKLPTDLLVRGFTLWKPPSWLSPQDGSPSLTLFSLFLSFIFCPTSFPREWADFLGAWCPLPVFRSCFVEVVQHSNDLLMNLCGGEWFPCPIPLPS